MIKAKKLNTIEKNNGKIEKVNKIDCTTVKDFGKNLDECWRRGM